ncbi:MAG: hypothetical protein H7X70_04845, partial [Candidatus Kapabacteria bacterium]|nr:hypothetical protein [Candidatus Kapabacteria bacterium]
RSEILLAIAGRQAQPPQPQAFTASLLGAAVQLSWQWPMKHPAIEVHLSRKDLMNGAVDLYTLESTDTSYLDTHVKEGGSYSYTLFVATENDTTRSNSLQILVPDVVVPIPPTNLKAVSDTGRIRLTWSRSPDADIRGYHVYRSSAEKLNVHLQLTKSLVSDTVYVDTLSRESETAHGYTVVAEDRAGHVSKPSDMLLAKTIDLNQPVAPQIIQFEQQGKSISITWTASVSADVASYIIEHSDSADVWTIVKSTSVTEAIVTVGGAGRHLYRVRAVDSSQNKSKPSIERVLVIREQLLAPQSVKVNREEVALKVEWVAVAGAHGYRIDRVDPRTGKRTTCATVAKSVLNWRDNISAKSQSWTYEVAARDATWRYGPITSVTFQPSKE